MGTTGRRPPRSRREGNRPAARKGTCRAESSASPAPIASRPTPSCQYRPPPTAPAAARPRAPADLGAPGPGTRAPCRPSREPPSAVRFPTGTRSAGRRRTTSSHRRRRHRELARGGPSRGARAGGSRRARIPSGAARSRAGRARDRARIAGSATRPWARGKRGAGSPCLALPPSVDLLPDHEVFSSHPVSPVVSRRTTTHPSFPANAARRDRWSPGSTGT